MRIGNIILCVFGFLGLSAQRYSNLNVFEVSPHAVGKKPLDITLSNRMLLTTTSMSATIIG